MWLPKHTESIGLKTRYLHSRRGQSVASVTESSCEPSSRWKKNDGHGALGGARARAVDAERGAAVAAARRVGVAADASQHGPPSGSQSSHACTTPSPQRRRRRRAAAARAATAADGGGVVGGVVALLARLDDAVAAGGDGDAAAVVAERAVGARRSVSEGVVPAVARAGDGVVELEAAAAVLEVGRAWC